MTHQLLLLPLRTWFCPRWALNNGTHGVRNIWLLLIERTSNFKGAKNRRGRGRITRPKASGAVFPSAAQCAQYLCIAAEQAYRKRSNLPLLTDAEIEALKAGGPMWWEAGGCEHRLRRRFYQRTGSCCTNGSSCRTCSACRRGRSSQHNHQPRSAEDG